MRRSAIATFAIALIVAFLGTQSASPAGATGSPAISGAGSTWAQVALDQWRRNLVEYGIMVNYAGTGSSDGRGQFRNGTVDFAVSDVPYGLTTDGVTDTPPSRSFAYVPLVAGGLGIMYNLTIGGSRVTSLRLSDTDLAGIFTGTISYWDAPQLKAHNPGLVLPHVLVRPVVRADGAGDSYQLSSWIAHEFPDTWSAYCVASGAPAGCDPSSHYPTPPTGFVAQSGSLGVSGFVAQSSNVGTITYVANSYALNTGFPTAKLLNKGGYYIGPDANNVSIALLKATVATGEFPDLDAVHDSTDPRAYPLSYVSSMIVPTAVEDGFTADKGATLTGFGEYSLCQGQKQAAVLGYAPLPAPLVEAGLARLAAVPGATASDLTLASCDSPTLNGGQDALAASVPQPAACDAAGPFQCDTAVDGPTSSRLSISPVAAEIIAGHPLDLRATLTGESPHATTWHALSGRTITLDRRSHGTTAWVRFTTRITDSHGQAVVRVTPTRHTDYRAVYSGSVTTKPSSAAVVVLVRFAVGLTSTRTSVRHGVAWYLNGSLAPARAGAHVYVEELVHGSWVRIRTATLDAHSRCRVAIRTYSVRTHTYRLSKSADVANRGTTSRPVAVRIT